jgi:cellulose synthase/poly-beta-1,6-N-acetylglucosamine synthase-like glycosyltransferase
MSTGTVSERAATPRLGARGCAAIERALARLPEATATRVITLVPAHNEEAAIPLALDSLAAQTRRPDLVILVADNCSDATTELVRRRGDAVVLTSFGNSDKKAGALNQVLDRLLPALQGTDAVLVMDADSALDPTFIEGALARLGTEMGDRHGGTIGGVGGTFRGGRGGGFVGMLQRNEYARYARDVRRLKGRALVLTGTAALFTVTALRDVITARRDGRLPGASGQVYDTHVLTEDNELTLALLHLGYRILSPRECLLETEVMTTWRDLWRQRLRWKRGALENLVDYGFTRVTWRYWGRQLVTHIGVIVTVAYLATIAYSATWGGGVRLHPIWLAVTAVFVAERIVTVRDRGPLQMLLAATLLVEMAFDLFLQLVQARAFYDTVTRARRSW